MRYSICVSGAAKGKTVKGAHDEAARVGAAIAKSGHILTTGATIGIPFHAAKAATEAKGMSIGFSPASSLREHAFKYRLPLGVYDFVNFTGMDYVGRDIHLVRSSDAVITVGGRIGSLHEFTTALESGVPVGVLTGTGGTADFVDDILEHLEVQHKDQIIMDDDPERLVKKVIKLLDEELGDIDTDDLVSQWLSKK